MNQIIIMGRLTADVEMRQTQAGDAVGSFSVAVDGCSTPTRPATARAC